MFDIKSEKTCKSTFYTALVTRQYNNQQPNLQAKVVSTKHYLLVFSETGNLWAFNATGVYTEAPVQFEVLPSGSATIMRVHKIHIGGHIMLLANEQGAALFEIVQPYRTQASGFDLGNLRYIV